jgi:hypothetical protein
MNIPRYDITRIAIEAKKDRTTHKKDKCAIGLHAFAPATDNITPTMLVPMPTQHNNFSTSRGGFENRDDTMSPTPSMKKVRTATTPTKRAMSDTTKPTIKTAFLALG